MRRLTDVVCSLGNSLAVNLPQHTAGGLDDLVGIGHDLVPTDDILLIISQKKKSGLIL